jgi:hypothetical protein
MTADRWNARLEWIAAPIAVMEDGAGDEPPIEADPGGRRGWPSLLSALHLSGGGRCSVFHLASSYLFLCGWSPGT